MGTEPLEEESVATGVEGRTEVCEWGTQPRALGDVDDIRRDEEA